MQVKFYAFGIRFCQEHHNSFFSCTLPTTPTHLWHTQLLRHLPASHLPPAQPGTKQPQEQVSSISTVLFYTSHMSSRPLTLISLHSFSLQLYGLGVTCPLEARDRWPRVTSWQCVTSSHAQRARGPERSCLWCWARCVGSYAAWSYRRNTEVQRR